MKKTVKTGKISIYTMGHPMYGHIYYQPAASLAHSFYGANSLSSASDQYQCRYPYFSNKALASGNSTRERRGWVYNICSNIDSTVLLFYNNKSNKARQGVWLKCLQDSIVT